MKQRGRVMRGGDVMGLRAECHLCGMKTASGQDRNGVEQSNSDQELKFTGERGARDLELDVTANSEEERLSSLVP